MDEFLDFIDGADLMGDNLGSEVVPPSWTGLRQS
jgi:hypothetical protein